MSRPPSASLLQQSDKSGWLEKRGGLRKTWKKRFFVLKDNELRYYKDQACKGMKGTIPVEGCSVEIAPEAKYHKKFCFELNSPLSNRTYVIVAENSSTLQEWMTAIRKAMLKIRRDRSKTEAQKRKNKIDEDDGLSTDHQSDSSSTNNNNNNNPSITHSSAQDSTSSHPLNSTPAPSSPERRISTSPKQDKSIIDIAQSRSRPTSLTAKHHNNQPHQHPNGDSKDNEKFGVYLQWLEETKDNRRKSVNTQPQQDLNGGSNVLHRHLLTEEEEQNKKQCLPCCPLQCPAKCVIS